MSLISTLTVFCASLLLLALPYRLSGVAMEFGDWTIAFAASFVAAAITASRPTPFTLLDATRCVLWTSVITHAMLVAWHFTSGVPGNESNARRGTRAAGATLALCSAALLATTLAVY